MDGLQPLQATEKGRSKGIVKVEKPLGLEGEAGGEVLERGGVHCAEEEFLAQLVAAVA